jgi:hypothetical protein
MWELGHLGVSDSRLEANKVTAPGYVGGILVDQRSARVPPMSVSVRCRSVGADTSCLLPQLCVSRFGQGHGTQGP